MVCCCRKTAAAAVGIAAVVRTRKAVGRAEQLWEWDKQDKHWN